MKFKTAALIAVVIISVFVFENTVYALATSATIRLTLRVVGTISLNLEDEWIEQALDDHKAEAFSELKKRDICVDKFQRDDSTIWRFTKTE